MIESIQTFFNEYSHNLFIALASTGFIFGIMFGWICWKGLKSEAIAIESDNIQLSNDIRLLKEKQEQLHQSIENLS